MNILMTSDTYFPRFGGGEYHVYYMMEGIRKCHHHVTLVTTEVMQSTEPDPPYIMRVSHRRGSFLRLVCILWRETAKADLVHAHYNYRLSFISGVIATIQRKPFVLTQHGLGLLPQVQTNMVYELVFRCWRYVGMFLAHRIVSTSDDLSETIRALGFGAKIILIPNGFDPDRFQPLAPSIGEKRLLTVRRLVPKTGIQYLIQVLPAVLKVFPTLTVDIVGDGRLRAELFAQADALGVGQCIIFHGALPHEKILEYFARATIVVFPSTAESTSLACIEAMALARPIVASRVGGLIELIGRQNERGYLVSITSSEHSDYNAPAALDQEAAERLANTIIGVLSSQAEAQEKARKAAVYAHQHFTWPSLVQKIINEVYEPLVRRRSKVVGGRLRRYIRELSALPFIRGVAVFQAGSVVMMATGFASSILYARLLGLEAFGLYAAVTAFAALLSIFAGYGQETVLVTFLSEAIGRKDTKAKNAVLRYYVQATIIATIVYVILIALMPILTLWLHANVMISNFVRLALLNTMLQPANTLLFIALQLRRKVAHVTIIENLSDIAQLILSVFLLQLGWGVMGILVGTLTITALSFPFFLFLYNRTARELGLASITQIARTLFLPGSRKFALQGFWISLDQTIGKNLYPNLFMVVLTATSTLQVVGVFRLAFRLAGIPLSLVMPSITRMTTVSLPRIATLDPSHLLTVCKKLIFGSVGLAAATAIVAGIFFPLLIPIIYGQEYVDSIPIFLILLITNIIAATHVVSVPLLRVFQRVWILSITNIIGVLLALASYFLVIHIVPAMFAMSIAFVIFHINSMLLFVYLRYFLRKRDSATIRRNESAIPS